MPAQLPLQAVAACLLTAAAATAVSGQVLAAGLVGSRLQGAVELSCVTEQTCGSLGNLAFEGYAFAQQGSQPQATCLCSDGTRVVAQGPAASATLALREVNGGLTAAAGCYADGMRWSLAAPFVGACRSGIAAGTCIPECADALLPFNLECFQSVLRQPFFAYAPGVELPSKEQLAAVYAACFPPSATAPAPAPAPALEQAASGAAVGGAAAPGQDATWLQGAES